MSKWGQLFIEFSEATNQFCAGRNHAWLLEPSHHLVNRLTLSRYADLENREPAANRRDRIALIFGNEHGITDAAIGNQPVELFAESPRCFVQVMSGEQDFSGRQRTSV